jgi:hypothetical protein
MNPNFDQIASTTLQRYRPKLADNVTDKSAVMFYLKKSNGVEEQDGGRTLVEPIIFAENTTAGSFRDYDIIPTDPQGGISAAEYPWSQLAVSITISGRQEFVNADNQVRIFSLLKGKTMQAQLTMTNLFNRQSHSDGAGNGGKDITGFLAAIESGVDGWNVYGGIDSQAQLYWRNQWIGYRAFTGVDLDQADAQLRTFRRTLTTFYNSGMRNTDRYKLFLTGQKVHEYLESTIIVNERYVKDGNISDSNLANAGFENLMFKSVRVVLDNLVFNTLIAAGADDQHIEACNTDFMKLIIGSGRNFMMTPFIRPYNQEAKVAQMILYAQYILNNRALQGRMDDIDFAAGQ